MFSTTQKIKILIFHERFHYNVLQTAILYIQGPITILIFYKM